MRRLSGQTERVLAAVVVDPSRWHHGYDLARCAGLASGSLYPILVRLADRGLLEARWDDTSGSGPRRHVYRVTPAGIAASRPAEANDAGFRISGAPA